MAGRIWGAERQWRHHLKPLLSAFSLEEPGCRTPMNERQKPTTHRKTASRHESSKRLVLFWLGLFMLTSDCVEESRSSASSSGGARLHENCSMDSDCQPGQSCLAWSYPAASCLGIRGHVQGQTCEIPCLSDSDCPPSLKCVLTQHGPGQACRDVGPPPRGADASSR